MMVCNFKPKIAVKELEEETGKNCAPKPQTRPMKAKMRWARLIEEARDDYRWYKTQAINR